MCNCTKHLEIEFFSQLACKKVTQIVCHQEEHVDDTNNFNKQHNFQRLDSFSRSVQRDHHETSNINGHVNCDLHLGDHFN